MWMKSLNKMHERYAQKYNRLPLNQLPAKTGKDYLFAISHQRNKK